MKRKHILWSILTIILFFFIYKLSVIPNKIQYNQDLEPKKKIIEPDAKEIDQLNNVYSNNKEIIKEFEVATLIALSYYPELKNVEIYFEYSDEATTMATRPRLSSLFNDRSYTIFINNNPNFNGILLKDTPFQAQIGVIGHELAHILDYESMSLANILYIGAQYLSDDGKINLERKVDSMTIHKGLGWQLYEWAKFSMYDSPKATDEYKLFKKKIYMNPEQIEIECRKIYYK